MAEEATRVWRPHWPCPVAQVLGALRHGPADPTYRVDSDSTIWRGVRTPEGIATLAVRSRPGLGEVRATAWGEGRDWVLAQLPAMLGGEDDPTGFETHHPQVAEAWRRNPHWRVGRSGLVFESLLPAVIEQKVTGRQAFGAWRTLVHRYGERAPGPGTEQRLWVMPSPQTVRAIPSWEWLRMQVDPARSRTASRVAGLAPSLERTVGLPFDEVDRRLQSIPGVAVWTSAEVRSRAHGDPDAVSFGDFHIGRDIGWALTGRPVDDEGLAELLAPYVPHRLRVQALLGLAGYRLPRRGPRMTVPTHLPG